MKKSEVLRMFGSKVLSYHRIDYTDILCVIVKYLTYKDFSGEFVVSVIDIQPWENDSIRVAMEVTEWDEDD